MLQAVPFSSLRSAPLRIGRAHPSPFPKMLSWLSSPAQIPLNPAAPIAEIQWAGDAKGFYRQGERTPAPPFKKRGSAAAYYGGIAMDAHPLPGADELNTFLKLQRQRVLGEGVVTVVLGNEAAGLENSFITSALSLYEYADLDSIASAVAFAYLQSQVAPDRESTAYLPLVNIPRADLKLRTDCLWLLTDSGVDIGALAFADEVDLEALRSSNRLRLILVDHNRLPTLLQALASSIVEIVDHHKAEGLYPWVTKCCIQPVGSCSTLVADRISEEAGEALANRVLCRLLLGAILLDTANFDPQLGRTLPADQTMGALLAGGAGALGCAAFARLLQEKKADQSHLTTEELLRRDYKQWALGPGSNGQKGEVINVGIASIGLPLTQVAGKDPNLLPALRAFSAAHNLHLLVLMTLYTATPATKFKRELALFSDLDSLSTGLAYHLQADKAGLQLRPINVKGLPDKVKAFTQGQVTASRKQVQPLLADYFLGDV